MCAMQEEEINTNNLKSKRSKGKDINLCRNEKGAMRHIISL